MIVVLWFCGRTSLLGGAEIFKSVVSRCQRFAFNYSEKQKYVKYTERRREKEKANMAECYQLENLGPRGRV